MENKHKKPIIGVIGRVDKDLDADSMIYLSENVRIAISRYGAIPLLIIPTQDLDYEKVRPKSAPKLIESEKGDLKCLVDLCDGIIFPGGYKYYEFDIFVYEYAKEKKIPILGICAGMQMINRIDMAKLDSNLYDIKKNETKLDHHKRTAKYVHQVDIKKGTLLHNIIEKDRIAVNSKHNYHADQVNEFIVSAISEDGLIEAIEYPKNDQFILGIQWHPETMLDYDEDENKLFKYFIDEVIKRKSM